MSLLWQWLDGTWVLVPADPVPAELELALVEPSPLANEPLLWTIEVTGKEPAIQGEASAPAGVASMEVRGPVVAVVHVDTDAPEVADARHVSTMRRGYDRNGPMRTAGLASVSQGRTVETH